MQKIDYYNNNNEIYFKFKSFCNDYFPIIMILCSLILIILANLEYNSFFGKPFIYLLAFLCLLLFAYSIYPKIVHFIYQNNIFLSLFKQKKITEQMKELLNNSYKTNILQNLNNQKNNENIFFKQNQQIQKNDYINENQFKNYNYDSNRLFNIENDKFFSFEDSNKTKKNIKTISISKFYENETKPKQNYSLTSNQNTPFFHDPIIQKQFSYQDQIISRQNLQSNNSYSKNNNFSFSPQRIEKNDRKINNYKESSIFEELIIKYRSEAENCIKQLNLEGEINKMLSNCKKWLFNFIINELVYLHKENLELLNKELNENFGKFLIEAEHYQKNNNKNYRFVKTNLNDIINYYQIAKETKIFWDLKHISFEESIKIHKRFMELIEKRLFFEKFIEIPKFKMSDIRNHIIEKLEIFNEKNIDGIQFQYFGEINYNLPTDNEILMNIFVNFMKIQIFDKTGNDSAKTIIIGSNFKTNFKKDEIWIQQINPEFLEPHFQIISGDEIWQTLPEKNNVFSTICLYFYHIKTKMKGVYSLENEELKKTMNMIFLGNNRDYY